MNLFFNFILHFKQKQTRIYEFFFTIFLHLFWCFINWTIADKRVMHRLGTSVYLPQRSTVHINSMKVRAFCSLIVQSQFNREIVPKPNREKQICCSSHYPMVCKSCFRFRIYTVSIVSKLIKGYLYIKFLCNI